MYLNVLHFLSLFSIDFLDINSITMLHCCMISCKILTPLLSDWSHVSRILKTSNFLLTRYKNRLVWLSSVLPTHFSWWCRTYKHILMLCGIAASAESARGISSTRFLAYITLHGPVVPYRILVDWLWSSGLLLKACVFVVTGYASSNLGSCSTLSVHFDTRVDIRRFFRCKFT